MAGACAHAGEEFSRADATEAVSEVGKIVSDNGVERLAKLRLGGLDQWVSIRGQDRDNPMLLFIHGGPGFATMPMSWSFQRPWEDWFTVVQWDQRGAGKTYAEHDPDVVEPTMTQAQIVSDAEELIQWLMEEYDKDKIVLAGLSWGSVVGVTIAQRHPEWLHAYVGFGQAIDFRENERRGWDYAMARAKAGKNEHAIRELEEIAPYPPASGLMPVEHLYTQRRWIEFYGGAMHNREGYSSMAAAVMLSPEYTDRDVAAFSEAPNYAFRLIFPELMEFDISDVHSFDCPIVLFLGRHDYNVVSTIAAEWLSRVKSPKELVWFEHSAHVVMSEEPGKTLVALVEKVWPFAEAAGDVPGPDD
jgi:proline iminopeptidase